MKRRASRLFFVSFATLLAVGCATVENDLVGEHAKRLRSWDEAVKVAQENRGAALLSWDKAAAVMLRHNPALQRARLDRMNAQRDADRVWEQLLPYFSLRSNRYSYTNVNELRDFSSTQFTADAQLYLERFVALPRDLYSVALAKARADAAWREAVKLRLLDLYMRCESLAAVRDARAEARNLSQLMARHPGFFRGIDRDDQENRARDFDQKLQVAEDALRDVLGVSYESVEVDPATFPAWAEAGERLLAAKLPQEGNPTFEPDPDWITLMAIEGAGAIARKRGILRGYWPELSVYLSFPSVSYDPSLGFSPVDFKKTTVSQNAYWSPNWILDTRDQLARAEDEVKLMREAFERQTDDRLHVMAAQARTLREAATHQADLGRRIAAVRELAPQLESLQAAELIQRSLRWQAEREDVRHQRRAGLAQLWFLSDNNQEVLTHAMLEKP